MSGPLVIPPIIVKPSTLGQELIKDIWVHIGGIIAILIGIIDIWIFNGKLGTSLDVVFIVAGFAAQGVKIVNGSAIAAANAAVQAINSIATQQQIDAQVAAAKVTDTATQTAKDLQPPV